MDKDAPYILEVCCYDLQAVKTAVQNGAHRIELCSNPHEGGTTPSLGMLQWVAQNITIPVFPIIRPRGGSFVYAPDEISCMAADIRLCKSLGLQGVVIGLLQHDGSVDVINTSYLVEIAYPMDVTFHRAFDRTKQPMQALEAIIQSGCTRILTSGQATSAMAGVPLLQQLIHAARNRITIMPGAGIRKENLALLAEATQAREFHTAAGNWQPIADFSPATMHEKPMAFVLNADEVAAMREILNTQYNTHS